MAGISSAERKALAEVKEKFESHEMTDEAAAAAEGLRKAFQKLGVELHRQLPAGRNKSLAMTHLEDSAMRAIRALSHDKPEPEEPAAVVETPADEAPAKVRKPRTPRAAAEPAPEGGEESATEMASPSPAASRKPRKRTAKAA